MLLEFIAYTVEFILSYYSFILAKIQQKMEYQK